MEKRQHFFTTLTIICLYLFDCHLITFSIRFRIFFALDRFALDFFVCWLLPNISNIPSRTTHTRRKNRGKISFWQNEKGRKKEPVEEIPLSQYLYEWNVSYKCDVAKGGGKKSILIRNSLKWRKRDRERESKKISKKEEQQNRKPRRHSETLHVQRETERNEVDGAEGIGRAQKKNL